MALYISDFRIGDTRVLQVQFSTDYSGRLLYFTMNDTKDTETPLIEVNSVIGTHALDGYDATLDKWLANITVPSDLTDTLEIGKFYYSMKLVSTDATPIVNTIYPPVSDKNDKVEIGYRLKDVS